jgi:hypothetical protein
MEIMPIPFTSLHPVYHLHAPPSALTGFFMPSPSVETIRYRLSRFERSVDAVIQDFKAPSGPGAICASAPYREKYRVRFLLDSSARDGEQYGILWQDYSRIVKKLEEFRNESGLEYRNTLFSELRDYVHAYHAGVCHARLGNAGEDTADGVSTRMLIGELCGELRDWYDLSEIEHLVSVLDENAGTGREVSDSPGDDSPFHDCHISPDTGDRTGICSRRRPQVREP